MLDAFLVKARPGKGAFGGEAGVDELGDVTPDATGFNDIGSVTRGQYSAIERMFELGVTRGTSDNQFSPGGLVTRAQMAAFITRMLAHTVARPAGLTMQASVLSVAGTADSLGDVDLVVSLRDSIHMAMPDESVDVFSSSNAGDAFGSDGRCSVDEVLRLGDGTGVCEIEVSDGQTDSDGDVEITGQFGASVTVWAWVGDVGDRFDADDTVSASLEITVTKPATKLRITDDMAANAMAAKFGASVKFTVQVVDEDGEAVALKDVSFNASVRESTLSGAQGASANHGSYAQSYKTDEDGKVEFTFRQTDPRSGSDNTGDTAWLDLDIGSGTLTSGSTKRIFELDDKTTLKMAGVEAGNDTAAAAVVWRDSTATPSFLKLSQDVSYSEASKADNGVLHVVRATLTDQFGDPVSRQKIHFTSDDPLGVGEQAEDALLAHVRTFALGVGTQVWRAYGFQILHDLRGEARYTRTTNRRGVAALTYYRKSDTSVIEMVRARLVRGEDDAKFVTGDPSDLTSEDRLAVYWVNELADGGSAWGRILVQDAENNRIVIGAADGGVKMVAYDPNDHFTGLSGPVALADFEKDLKGDAAHVTVSGYDDSARGVSSFTLAPEWEQVDLSKIPVPTALGLAATNLNGGNVHYAVDGDTIVVGSYRENNYAGAVYVYDGPDDATPTRLTAPTPQPSTFTGDYSTGDWFNKPWYLNLPTSGGWFGWAVDIRGDTLVVGEPGRLSSRMLNFPGGSPIDGAATDGTVYVYTRGGGGDWVLDATFTASLSTLGGTPHNQHGFEFGSAVAVSKNEEVIAVGAPRYIADVKLGGVYLYERPTSVPAGTGAWNDDDGANSTRLEPTAADINANHNRWSRAFARYRELAVSEDGSTVVVAGSELRAVVDGVTYEWAGAAYVFTEPDGGWTNAVVTPDAKLTSPTPYHSERLGRTVAVSANGDTVLVSANFRPNMMRRGKVLVFARPASTSDAGKWDDDPSPSAVLRPPDHPDAPSTCTSSAGPVLGCNIGELFGQWVDITDDGDRILASRSYRTEGYLRGAMHLFTKPAGGWSTVTDSNQPASVEYLGAEPRAALGWRNHFDQSTGNIWTADNDPDAGNALRMFRIDPAS